MPSIDNPYAGEELLMNLSNGWLPHEPHPLQLGQVPNPSFDRKLDFPVQQRSLRSTIHEI